MPADSRPHSGAGPSCPFCPSVHRRFDGLPSNGHGPVVQTQLQAQVGANTGAPWPSIRCIGAYLGAIKVGATAANRFIAEAAAQILGVACAHRALIRDIAGEDSPYGRWLEGDITTPGGSVGSADVRATVYATPGDAVNARLALVIVPSQDEAVAQTSTTKSTETSALRDLCGSFSGYGRYGYATLVRKSANWSEVESSSKMRPASSRCSGS